MDYIDLLIKTKIERALHESIQRVLQENSDKMLLDLYNYLSQEPTEDICHTDNRGIRYPNNSHKAYNYFDNPRIVHNVWAIHFTNLEGFEDSYGQGTFKSKNTDYDKLAYANSLNNDDAEYTEDGWKFALPLDNDYIGEDCGYGDCGFIIRTDGVMAYHKLDHDDEIIFNNACVKQKIPFMFNDDDHTWTLFDSDYPPFNSLQELIDAAI